MTCTLDDQSVKFENQSCVELVDHENVHAVKGNKVV